MDKLSVLTSLTKENFFDELQEMCPRTMKQFCEWIDVYKDRVEWNTLFRYADPKCGYTKENCLGVKVQAPKFHELPIGLQIGVIITFLLEINTSHFNVFSGFKVRSTYDLIQFISESFDTEEKWKNFKIPELKP